MSKVILTCGKICSGKTTYAQQLRDQSKAVLLSVDEIMLALFGQHCGDDHDMYAKRTKKYLLDKSVELIKTGIDVILDWGFWQKAERDSVKAFYQAQAIPCEMHYIDITDETWKNRLHKRNSAVLAGNTNAYYVDENLAAKFGRIFEIPGKEEIDVWVTD